MVLFNYNMDHCKELHQQHYEVIRIYNNVVTMDEALQNQVIDTVEDTCMKGAQKHLHCVLGSHDPGPILVFYLSVQEYYYGIPVGKQYLNEQSG